MELQANNPALKSWIEYGPDTDFPIQNLPFGTGRKQGQSARAFTAIGDFVVDLAVLFEAGMLADCGLPAENLFERATLNDFISLGRGVGRKVRNRLSALLSADHAELRDNEALRSKAISAMSEVEMLMPVQVGDYTDFYSSIEHATNVGTMFRDPDNALLPNWKWLPVGYHGRASSIVVSGTPVHRPLGQTKAPDAAEPSFGPSQRVDFELEMAFITCTPNALGQRIKPADAEEHIFGMVLFNDWSARDMQVWEYVPLGPFLAKNFASSVSPWIVTLDALEPFRVAGPEQNPAPMPYLKTEGAHNFDIHLEVGIAPQGSEEKTVCRSNFKYMYWSMAQQLAHHTVNGCNINAGDMYGSGTISGPTPDSYGSMLEIAWKGTKPVPMPDGSERKFILDNDTVIMRGYCKNDQVRIGFGEVRSQLLPATDY